MVSPSRQALGLLVIALVCSSHVAAFHTAPIAPLRSAKLASPSLRGTTATRAGLPLHMSANKNEVGVPASPNGTNRLTSGGLCVMRSP